MPDLAIGLTGQTERKKVRVVTDAVSIGRSKDCDLTIGHSSLSRTHCRIANRDDAWTVEDLGSAAGTLVNGIPITAPHPLSDGDVIRCGQVEVLVERLAAEPGTASGAKRQAVGGRHRRTKGVVLPSADIAGEDDVTRAEPAITPPDDLARTRRQRRGMVTPRSEGAASIEPGQGAAQRPSTVEMVVGDLNYEADDFSESDQFLDHGDDEDDHF